MYKVACWNVRGLNRPSKKLEVKDWIRRDRLSCVVLLEVKLQEDRWEGAMRSCCPSESWKGMCSIPFEGWARVMILWDDEVIKISQVDRDTHYICCTMMSEYGSFGAAFVYASNAAEHRALMWVELENKLRQGGGSWLCVGDFNCILKPGEKRNGKRVRDTELEDLRNFVTNCDLNDIDASEHIFTWSNNNIISSQRIWCKLDRAMSNEGGLNQHPNVSAVFLPPGISDHCPLVVSWGETCNFWEELDDYQDKVDLCWKSSRDCNNLFLLQDKLKAMKRMMKGHFVKVTRGMEKRVAELRSDLGEVQILAIQHPSDPALALRELHLAKEFRKVKGYQFLFYQQRAKLRWLKEGDANSKYLHSLMKGQRSKNSIRHVKDAAGVVHTDEATIKKEFVNYFKSILAETIDCSPIDPDVVKNGKLIEDEQCRNLIREATDVEIWKALSSIGSDKSPGPDGFSASFFRKNWSLVGKEFCSGIRHCLKFNALPKGINSAFIALIPKSKMVTVPGDYRPISCYNVVYKVLSGLLAERLKLVLPTIIDPVQGAFIQGRSIVGNVCLAQQLVSGYGRKVISERMAWKIDLRKAYDTVDWQFLHNLLVILKFPLKFISWIDMCVRSTSFSLQINGELVDYFEGKRGLRQGSGACGRETRSRLSCLPLLWPTYPACLEAYRRSMGIIIIPSATEWTLSTSSLRMICFYSAVGDALRLQC
ncbi:hypothetical protein QQ045_026180 [Rhodiola kirilowii]